MNRIFKNKKVLLPIFAILIMIITFIKISYSEELEDDVEVDTNSILTYYLHVTYDGIDRNGVHSNDTTIANINSGYMQIEDKLPDGLTFEGFVTTSDGSIGAVRRDNENIGCFGKVVDDTNDASPTEGTWNNDETEYTYHGLHYNKSTRTVSFKVNKLQAGCKLTVGIITRTPLTIDDPDTPVVEKRRDFYNFGNIIEKALSKNSNTVHVYMGRDDEPLYNVVYSYTGTVPNNAPLVPSLSNYIEGTSVGVASNPSVEGYTFSGWATSDVTVSNNSFTMPNTNVTFTGSFTENPKYNVRYTINGTNPEGYILPSTKNYYENAIVKLDSLKIGDVFNGYRFLGWGSSDVDITSDNNFVVPNHDVTIVGSFELVTYTVSYAFYDTLLPPNSNNYLPESETHRPGEIVTLPEVNDPEGYHFLGWYKENNFEMPNNDLTIYGEWGRQIGTFEPTITKELISQKSYYHPGDIVNFRINVTNTANFAITDVIVKEINDNAYFTSGTGYTIQSDHFAKIDSMNANSSITLNASYVVQNNDNNIVTNSVELVSALANENYVLKEQDYIATANFNIQSKITICKNINGVSLPNEFQFHITGTNYDSWITIEKDECDSVYVDPGTYRIVEIIPQEYEIYSVTGAINHNDSNLIVTQGSNYNITFTNKFRQKGFYHSFGRIENKIGGTG